MKKKLLCLSIAALLVWIGSAFVSMILFWILFALGFFAVNCAIVFLLANKMIKKTNWWKNQYLFTEQFVSNSGYRDNIVRNYDIVNLGSNPALYAFFYENVKGQSWATGSQGQDMDFEILKYFHSYLKEGATVLIPIMPFTAIAPYIKTRKEYWGLAYYTKFAKILDYSQAVKLPYGRILKRYLKYPLLYNKKAIKYIIRDTVPSNTFSISEQPLMNMQLKQDAEKWINAWKKEFKLKSLSDVFNPTWNVYYDEAIDLSKKIVDFCLERGYKPIFICVPMTKHLSSLFPDDVRKYLVSDFVAKANVHNIPFFDYTLDAELQNPNLYFNSFFLNLSGRKLFTRQVLKDLGI